MSGRVCAQLSASASSYYGASLTPCWPRTSRDQVVIAIAADHGESFDTESSSVFGLHFIYGFAEGVKASGGYGSTDEVTVISATIARRTGSAASGEASSGSRANSGATASSGRAGATPRKPSIPTGAAGFMFGDTVGEAGKTCTDAGFEWKDSGENRMTCSGLPVSGGLSGAALVRFCEKEVCSIQLTMSDQKDSAKAWMEQYDAIQQALIRKYGAVHDNKYRVPQECMAASFSTCFEEKKATLASFWKWESGERVSIQLGAPAGRESLAIRIVYAKETNKAESKGEDSKATAPSISTEGL